ncbi:hypothetical protein [Nitrosococcus wardiae]|uniref:Uncharacterized protein n=1 Tax=Nitrosococcus wardiae TaxID=1814290 RepID=A0A4P7C023_9GAMM|nr:hypothetical protein [Nitrosococcus wardiae]QBQ55878.1 hypothetical protein E3U44_16160 [Nitrosococcus wardiae]
MRANLIKVFCFSGGIPLVLLLGCTSTDPVRVEQDFGNSVRNMIQAQIYDPEAARNPPVDPPAALDGAKAGEALKEYRQDVGKPSKVEKELPLNILIGQ